MTMSGARRPGRATCAHAIGTARIIALGLILTSYTAAHATSYSWNVASGDWFTPGNWNPTGVPGAGDDAVISNFGTVTLNGAASVTNFTQSNGVRSGTGTLDVSGTLSWSGGDLNGVTNANGPLSISGGAVKRFLGTLNVNSSATWTGAGNIQYTAGLSTLNVAAGATFDVQTDADIANNDGGSFGTINNAGTIQKSAGAGETRVGSAGLHNAGLIDVQVGTLSFRGGGTSTGMFDATGATLVFESGTQNLTAAAAITGGSVTVSGGTLNHAGTSSATVTMTVGLSGTANLTGPGPTLNALSLGGTLNVNTSTPLNVSGTFGWGGGTLTGVMNANGPVSISGGGTRYLQGTLNINSSATWTGSGIITYFPGTSILNVAAGALFEIQGNSNLFRFDGTSFLTLNNAGTLQRTVGTGTATLGSAGGLTFNNSGTTQSSSGTLRVEGAYTQTAGATRLN